MSRSIPIVLAIALAVPAVAFPFGSAAPSVSEGVFVSFDGTRIVWSFFLPDGASASSPVPLVLMTHGWAGSRATSATSGMVKDLLDSGYAVLTWDQRGFGQSGGFVELNSVDHEVKDVMGLIDVFGARPEVLNVGADPVVGMVGGSYAGGIQLLTAAFDPRIDAIVPDITWNDLRQSLGPGGVPKEGWIQVLFGSGLATGTALGMDPRNPAGPDPRGYGTNLPSWYAQVHAVNGLTPEVDEGLRVRSPSQYNDGIEAKVLITQGWPDTLFNANEAVANFQQLEANGNDVRILFYCGGHAACPYVAGDAHVRARALAFLNETLKGAAPVVPKAEWQDNTGAFHTAAAWPPPTTTFVSNSGTLTLVSTPAPTGGGGFRIGAGGVSGSAMSPFQDEGVGTGSVPVFQAAAATQVTGIGRAHVAVDGLGTEAFLFLRLVDETTGRVLHDQAQAIRVPVGDAISVDLVGISYVLPAGHILGLEISTSDLAHATNRVPGVFDLTVSVDVPVVG